MNKVKNDRHFREVRIYEKGVHIHTDYAYTHQIALDLKEQYERDGIYNVVTWVVFSIGKGQ